MLKHYNKPILFVIIAPALQTIELFVVDNLFLSQTQSCLQIFSCLLNKPGPKVEHVFCPSVFFIWLLCIIFSGVPHYAEQVQFWQFCDKLLS